MKGNKWLFEYEEKWDKEILENNLITKKEIIWMLF